MTASLLVVRGRRDGNVGRETRRDRAAVATRSDRPYGTASAPHTRHTAERGTGAFPAQAARSGRGGRRRGGQRDTVSCRLSLWADLWTTDRDPVDKRWNGRARLGRRLWSRSAPRGARVADQPQCCAPGVDRKYLEPPLGSRSRMTPP